MNATAVEIDDVDDVVVVEPSTLLAFGILNASAGFLGLVLSLTLAIATGLPLLVPSRRKKYSTFNLYLFFLSLSDCVLAGSFLFFAVRHTPWRRTASTAAAAAGVPPPTEEKDPLWFVGSKVDQAICATWGTANMYLNAFLTREIYTMLKRSSLLKRYRPPTIRAITRQAIISLTVGVAVFLIDAVIGPRLDRATDPRTLALGKIYQVVVVLVCMVLPLSVPVVLSGIIWWKGLIRSTKSLYGGRLRVLSFFFLRVVVLDIAIWVPATIGFSAQWFFDDPRTHVLAFQGSLLLASSQCVINFVCSLTKADTRKLVADLLGTVLCCRPYVDAADDHRSNGDTTAGSSLDDSDGRFDYFLGRLESSYLRRSVSAFARRRRSSSVTNSRRKLEAGSLGGGDDTASSPADDTLSGFDIESSFPDIFEAFRNDDADVLELVEEEDGDETANDNDAGAVAPPTSATAEFQSGSLRHLTDETKTAADPRGKRKTPVEKSGSEISMDLSC